MPDIMIVTEGLEEEDLVTGKQFSGTQGHFLRKFLSIVGINLHDCAAAPVFYRTLPNEDLKPLCGKKTEGIPGLPEILKGKYVRAEFAGELERLYRTIDFANPKVIIAFGAGAAWALLHSSGIKAIRGAIAPCVNRPIKVLPTYSINAILKDWTLRPVLLADLDKAKTHSTYRELIRPHREIWIKPTLADLALFEREHINTASMLSIDIETKGNQITCIGFSPNEKVALVIPFYTSLVPSGNYWPTLADELKAWSYVRKWCQRPSLFQNGMYDIHFTWRRYGIPVPLAAEDTMLLHHAYQIEMEKGLGFLATIYTDEASWKFMRKTDTIKKED